MNKPDKIKRNLKIMEYLKTPLKDEKGNILKDPKGKEVYPSMDQAAKEFGLHWSSIAKIKNSLKEIK